MKRKVFTEGQEFENTQLTFVEDAPPKIVGGGRKIRRITVTCSCGITKDYNLQDITSGKTTTCGGCIEKTMGAASRDKVKTKCVDCGVEKEVLYSNLTRLKSGYRCRSCGCKKREQDKTAPRAIKLTFEIGHRFERLTVVAELEPQVSPQGKQLRRFELRCDCGSNTKVLLMHLRSGRTKSCGCLKKERQSEIAAEVAPHVGELFGRWKVLVRVADQIVGTRPRHFYKCECICGNTATVQSRNLRLGTSKSCGCDRQEKLLAGAKPKIHVNLEGQKFGKWTIISELEPRIYEQSEVKMVLAECECGTKKPVIFQSLYMKKSECCGCSQQSQQELDVLHYIKYELGITPCLHQDRTQLQGLEIDIYLPELKLGIEYNGNYWHSSARSKDLTRHFAKRERAEARGIQLIQIRSDEWLNKPEIVKSILKTKLGMAEHKHFARKLTVTRIHPQEAKDFANLNHLMGSYRSARHLGLRADSGDLVQLFSYKLLKEQTILDCSRICSARNTSVVGGVSRLLKAALREHSTVGKVVSFVDLRYADGHSLAKLGFELQGVTLGWGWTDGSSVFNRLSCRANLDNRLMSEREHAAELGWFKLYDAGQAKFVMKV